MKIFWIDTLYIACSRCTGRYYSYFYNNFGGFPQVFPQSRIFVLPVCNYAPSDIMEP